MERALDPRGEIQKEYLSPFLKNLISCFCMQS